MTCLVDRKHQRQALVVEQVFDLQCGPLKLGLVVDGVPEVLAQELDLGLRLQLAVQLGEVDEKPEGRDESRQILMRGQDGNEKHSLDGDLDFSARESDVVAGATAQLFHNTVDTAGGGGEERAEFGRPLRDAVQLGELAPCVWE